jgi:hypothetical protein
MNHQVLTPSDPHLLPVDWYLDIVEAGEARQAVKNIEVTMPEP